MSGAFGHIMHPYEDLDLTIGELKSMLTAVASGDVRTYEKFDGVNLMLRIDDGRLRFARSTSELRSGGFGIDRLLNRFPNASIVGEVIHNAAAVLHAACFAHDVVATNGWCSVDVISGRLTNVVRYDHDAIAVHPLRVTEAGLEWNVMPLGELHERARACSISIVGPHAVSIDALSAIDGMHASLGALSDDRTLSDVCCDGIEKIFRAEIMDDPWMAARVAKRIVRAPGFERLPELKKHWLNSTRALIGRFVNDEVRVKRAARVDVERTVRTFAIECLANVGSCLISHPQEELRRRRVACFMKLNELAAGGSKKHAHDIEILGELDDLSAPVEGIVFQWENGKLYKLTGLFRHLNQVMGSGRYDRA